MTQTVESAHVTQLRDQRQDALRVLGDVRERIEAEAGTNPVMQAATSEALLALQEATERLRDYCPVLFPSGPVVDETCCCWRCSYDEPFTDPFEGSAEPG